MGKSTIEWTERTWNPVTGCSKVTPGCDNCYAERVTNRFKLQRFTDILFHVNRLNEPLSVRKPSMFFVCSMGDLFHDQVPFDFVSKVFMVMASAPRHTFQVLTKRPGRMAYYAKHLLNRWPPNIWAGTSVESAKYLPRLDVLARVPAKVRFVSAEPLLGPLNLRPWLRCVECDDGPHGEHQGQSHEGSLDWVIVGGESGPGARPMHPAWVRDIRDQCAAARAPLFVKQDSGPRPGMRGRLPDDLWALKEMLGVAR